MHKLLRVNEFNDNPRTLSRGPSQRSDPTTSGAVCWRETDLRDEKFWSGKRPRSALSSMGNTFPCSCMDRWRASICGTDQEKRRGGETQVAHLCRKGNRQVAAPHHDSQRGGLAVQGPWRRVCGWSSSPAQFLSWSTGRPGMRGWRELIKRRKRRKEKNVGQSGKEGGSERRGEERRGGV